jgi:hypothetical protein
MNGDNRFSVHWTGSKGRYKTLSAFIGGTNSPTNISTPAVAFTKKKKVHNATTIAVNTFYTPSVSTRQKMSNISRPPYDFEIVFAITASRSSILTGHVMHFKETMYRNNITHFIGLRYSIRRSIVIQYVDDSSHLSFVSQK